jgi:predicted metalloprotease
MRLVSICVIRTGWLGTTEIEAMQTRAKTSTEPTTQASKKRLKVKTRLQAGCLNGCFQHNEKLVAKPAAKKRLKVKTRLQAGCLSGCFQHNEKLVAR